MNGANYGVGLGTGAQSSERRARSEKAIEHRSEDGGLRLGTAAQLACLASVILTAALASGWRVAIVCGLSLGLALVFCRPGLALLARVWLWATLVALVLWSALLGEGPGWRLLGLPVSAAGLEMGAQMALRAIAICVAAAGFAASVSIGDLALLLDRVGLRGLGFALGVAVNMLPTVQNTAATTFHAFRLRGGFRRRRVHALRLLLVTIVANSICYAEDVVAAAEARAFSVDRRSPPVAVRMRYDFAVLAFLLVFTVALLLP